MKFNFTIKAINSSFDDSSFFMRNVYKKRAILFDCGRLGGLDNSELLDISEVFISHTHMDHFSGFDRFLRGCLNSGNTIRFFGPSGFIRNMEGRLASYNWNLIRDYNLTLVAIELTPEGNKGAEFSTKNKFIRKDIEAPQGDIDINDGFVLKYEFFDHGIPSIGYRVKEPVHISISKESLQNNGFLSGPWLKDLKNALLLKKDKDTFLNALTTTGEQQISIKQLENSLVEYKKRQDVTYITDIAPSFENYKKAVRFATNSSVLIIEAVFMKNDCLHAEEKKHLTQDLAKDIFFKSGSDYVRFHHFSSRYDRTRDVFLKSLNRGISEFIFSCS